MLELLWEGDVPTDGTIDRPAAPVLYLRGGPRCETREGRIVRLEAKDALLLAWLALEGPTPRARLASLLWPAADDARSRPALRQRLARLKRSLGFDAIAPGELASLCGLTVADVQADTGTLLDGIEADPGSEIGTWLTARRNTARHAHGEALAARASSAETAGELAAALRDAQALVDLDPTSEHAHRRVMRLHYLRGDVGAALAAYERCREALQRALGVAPSLETVQLARQVNAVVATAPRLPMPVTLLRTPRLIGRDRELTAIRAAWQSGRAALLMGEAGMGKSRLLAELALERAHGGGPPGIVVAQGRPGDAAIPYATLARLLRRVRECGEVVLDPVRTRELARILPELDPQVSTPSDSMRLVLQGAAETLLTQARVHCLLLDDLHFADEASLELIQAIVGNGALANVDWAFAQRPGEDSPATALFRATLEGAELLESVMLGPLDEAEMSDFVDSLGIEELDGGRLGALLCRRTGGNPMFALEVLKQGLSSGRFDEWPTQTPVHVGALIERRLKQLSERALALARVAAIAGVDFGVELAESVMAMPALDLADAWAELEASQVFKGDSFAHDLVYEAVLGTIPLPIARHLHGASAAHLAATGGEPARVAAHWLEAGLDEPAVNALVEAATRARRAGRFVEAGRFELTAADTLARLDRFDEAFERRFMGADDMSLTAPLDVFKPIALALDALARNERQRGQAALGMAHLLINQGAMVEAEQRLTQGLAAARAAGDREIEAELLFGEGYIHHWNRRLDASFRCREAAIAILDEIGNLDRAATMRRSLADSLGKLGRVREATRAIEPAARHLLSIKAPDLATFALDMLAALRLHAGEPEAAAEAMKLALAIGEDASFSEAQRYLVCEDRLNFAIDRGDYAAAIRVWQDAAPLLRGAPTVHSTSFRIAGATLMFDLGRLDLLRPMLEQIETLLAARPRLEALTLLELRAGVRAAPDFFGKRPREAVKAIPGVPGQTLALAYCADALPHRQALAWLDQSIEHAEIAGMRGYLAGLHAAQAEALLGAGRIAAAIDAAAAALDALEHHGSMLYRPLVWLRSARVLHAASDRTALQACLVDGARWLGVVATSLPDVYRHSFMERNATNQQLRAMAAQERARA